MKVRDEWKGSKGYQEGRRREERGKRGKEDRGGGRV